MVTLIMLCALAQSPGSEAPATVELFVPKNEAVKRCVGYVSDAAFREKLRDLAALYESNSNPPYPQLIELPPAPSRRAAAAIREFLIHQDYETAVVMLMSVRLRNKQGNKATAAMETICRSTDRWKYSPLGIWSGNVLPADLYDVVETPRHAIAALESNATLKELHRLHPTAKDVNELFDQIEQKYSGKLAPVTETKTKDAA